MRPYDLSQDAEDDLKDIARYTLKQWGANQSLRYAGLLEDCFLRIAAGSALSKTLFDAYPQLRVTRCEHHYVFFIRYERKPTCIIAVLHERMNMISKLKDRLD